MDTMADLKFLNISQRGLRFAKLRNHAEVAVYSGNGLPPIS